MPEESQGELFARECVGGLIEYLKDKAKNEGAITGGNDNDVVSRIGGLISGGNDSYAVSAAVNSQVMITGLYVIAIVLIVYMLFYKQQIPHHTHEGMQARPMGFVEPPREAPSPMVGGPGAYLPQRGYVPISQPMYFPLANVMPSHPYAALGW